MEFSRKHKSAKKRSSANCHFAERPWLSSGYSVGEVKKMVKERKKIERKKKAL